MNFDEDALIAAVELVGRSGARDFEVGYLDDGVPAGQARWYAHAAYRGRRVTVEDHRSPVEAAEALARRLLDGGMCTHCGRTVSLSTGPGCRWTRMDRTWVRGCAQNGR